MPTRLPFVGNARRFAVHVALVLGAATFYGAGRATATTERQNPYALLDQLGSVLSWIDTQYVDPVDRSVLIEGALEGMVARLDPHSAYLTPEDYRIFQDDTEGRFGGVGVEVDFAGDWVTVIAPIEGSPAERAGVRSGDRIMAIDHQSVRRRSPAELVRQMRGPPGTQVLLTVRRDDERTLYLNLTREIIDVRSVATKLLAENVGYLRIKAFQNGTQSELLEEVGKLRQQSPRGLRGVILDLRDNPGGLVSEATAVADEILSGGVVFTTRRRGKIVDRVHAGGGGALRREPFVVLVNEFTASSAELLTGALQDNHRATVIGTTTFGKGSVQTIVDLPGGAGLRLTTLRYHTPSGRAIQAQGIVPDLEVASERGDFGIVREKNLEGHLPAEQGAPTVTPTPELEADPARTEEPDAIRARTVPFDPRTGDDAVLSIGFKTLLEATTPAR